MCLAACVGLGNDADRRSTALVSCAACAQAVSLQLRHQLAGKSHLNVPAKRHTPRIVVTAAQCCCRVAITCGFSLFMAHAVNRSRRLFRRKYIYHRIAHHPAIRSHCDAWLLVLASVRRFSRHDAPAPAQHALEQCLLRASARAQSRGFPILDTGRVPINYACVPGAYMPGVHAPGSWPYVLVSSRSLTCVCSGCQMAHTGTRRPSS